MEKEEWIKQLKTGDMITLVDPGGNKGIFEVNTGDAMMNGETNHIWLCSAHSCKKQYVRKLPENELAIGVALFASSEELSKTIQSKTFYFG